jgi:hypothetical protein
VFDNNNSPLPPHLQIHGLATRLAKITSTRVSAAITPYANRTFGPPSHQHWIPHEAYPPDNYPNAQGPTIDPYYDALKSIMKSIEWATNEFVSTVIISNHPVGMSMVAPATPGCQPQDLGLTHREYRPFSEGLHNVGGYNNPTKAANVVQCQTHLETPDARMSRELATTSTIVICLPWP